MLNMLRIAAFAALDAGMAAAADPTPTVAELQTGIEGKHPAACYQLAAALMAGGRTDEAVFWFYAGQLRYRVHLACHSDLDPRGDPALFASLSESVGRPVNEYAFGDISVLAATLDNVLAWDATPNGFTDKIECAAALASTRNGLTAMRQQVLEQADEIRRQRTANGLPNR